MFLERGFEGATDVPISYSNSATVSLKDIGHVRDGNIARAAAQSSEKSQIYEGRERPAGAGRETTIICISPNLS